MCANAPVCMCVHMCLHKCACVRTCACMCARVPVCVHVYWYACMHVCLHVCHVPTCAHVRTHTRVWCVLYLHAHVCMYRARVRSHMPTGMYMCAQAHWVLWAGSSTCPRKLTPGNGPHLPRDAVL